MRLVIKNMPEKSAVGTCIAKPALEQYDEQPTEEQFNKKPAVEQ